MFDKAKALKQAWDFQRQLKKKVVTSKSNNGKVKIIANGLQEVQKVQIEESFLNPENRKEIQKAIKEAYNNLQDEMKDIMKDQMPNIGDLLGQQ